MLMGVVAFGVVSCGSYEEGGSNPESKQELIHSGTVVENYDQLLKSFKNGDKFLIEFRVGEKYTPKAIQKGREELGMHHSQYFHYFRSGVLEDNGNIKFSIKEDWSYPGALYTHTFNYVFEPSNKVTLNGEDSLIRVQTRNGGIPQQGSNHKYYLTSQFKKGVIVYSYK